MSDFIGDNQCVTHHHACDCREAEFAKLLDENKQLRGEEPIPYAWWAECPKLAQRTMERIIQENSRFREVLDKLSRLGNEPHLGNSDGNKIAHQALTPSVTEPK